MENILDIQGLKTFFINPERTVKAVDDVSFSIKKRSTFGLVGESGCGKSITARSILRLLPRGGKVVGGSIIFEGRNLLDLSENEMRKVRGNQISMISQEPLSALNPVYSIGFQIMEAIMMHQKLNKKEAKDLAIEMLQLTGIPDPHKRVDEYPHQMSGGMMQRAMIAMALSCNPNLLIADEPTTALDVTVQSQILDLMAELREKIDTSILLITHDLGVIAEVTDVVAVMYAGKIVEIGTTHQIFKEALHPYTKGLLTSLPVRGKKELVSIGGVVPNLSDLPSYCSFFDRCGEKKDSCKNGIPSLKGGEHKVRCWRR